MKQTFMLLALLISWQHLFGQISPLPFHGNDYQTVAKANVVEFNQSRCFEKSKYTYEIEKFPFLFRSAELQKVYDFEEWQNFSVFFAENRDATLHEIHKGKCRGFSVSFLAQHQGIYWIRIWHQSKPSLIEINATDLPNITIENHLGCVLHSTAFKDKLLIDKHFEHFGNEPVLLTMYYKFSADEIWRKVQTAQIAGIFSISNINFGKHYFHFSDGKTCFYYELAISASQKSESFGAIPNCIKKCKKPEEIEVKITDEVLQKLNKSD